jgi:mRNA-degrading endonuclease RelE of RelBE toxin-antitoxin system
VKWTKRAASELGALPHEVQRRIDEACFAIEEGRKQPSGVLVGPLKQHFKVKVPPYRVLLLRNEAGEYVVVAIGHRGSVYRR